MVARVVSLALFTVVASDDGKLFAELTCTGSGHCDDDAVVLRQLRSEVRLASVKQLTDPEDTEDDRAAGDPASCGPVRAYCADVAEYEGLNACPGTLCKLVEVGSGPQKDQFCVPQDPTCKDDDLLSEMEDEEQEEQAAQIRDLLNVSVAAAYSLSSSCRGRCKDAYNSFNYCQCTPECGQHGNCCSDYADQCKDSGTKSVGGPTMTLYHTTSRAAAESIVQTGFRPGKAGWCGGAIYFIDTPYLPKTKYAPGITETGAILEAQVQMGRMATFDNRCRGPGGKGTPYAERAGYNSIKMNKGDGPEFIIWDPSQVVSVKIYEYTS